MAHRKVFIVLRDSAGIFSDKSCIQRAAAISFYAFFSLIPMMFLVTYALGFILGSRGDMLDEVIKTARISLPYLDGSVIEELKGVVAHGRTFGWVSIVALVFSAELVLNAVADALSAIFEIGGRYGFVRKRITNVFVILLAVFAVFASIIVTAAMGVVESATFSLPGLDMAGYVLEILALKYVFPFVLVVVAVTVVFKIFSGPELYLRYAFFGSLIFSFIWELAKWGFTLYLYYFPTYNRLYGSLGTIMILLLWMFFTAAIFLFSAAVARAAFIDRNY
ncbi:MAG: YihY/virulence factor BrkB family protein [Thermodesulfobacteriota bacterium]